jgi:hypothetical protein
MPVIFNHYIPDFYFVAFAEQSENPDSVQPSASESLWINSKILKPTWKKIPVANLVDHLKNLDPIDSNADLVAERLSGLSTGYSSITKKLAAALTLNRDELFGLSFLILTLLSNAESPRYRSTDMEIDADEFTWEKFESAVLGAKFQAKQTRSSLTIDEGNLLDHGMHFILNRTGNPFITSDRAIFVDAWTPQEAERIFGILGILDSAVSGGTERVTVLPVSPEAVIVSSAFIERGYRTFPYIECASVEAVFALNLLASYGAERIVISNKDSPFGRLEDKARSLLLKSSLG